MNNESEKPSNSDQPLTTNSDHSAGLNQAIEPNNLPVKENEVSPPVAQRANPLALFIPGEGYLITPILIWINVVLFMLMALTGVNLLHPASDDLIRWGANYSPLTLDDQPWRFLSSCFLHIGVIHLVFNMYALLQIGLLLEPILGSRQFVIAYLMAGLAGSVVSLWWHEIVLGAGASGAIFGLYGVFLALLTTNWFDVQTRRDLMRNSLIFVGYNLVIGLQAGIDNAAHMGGLLAGLLFGYTYYFSALHPSRASTQAGWLLLMPPILTVVTTIVVYVNTGNPFGEYDRLLKRFSLLEAQALSVFRLPPTTSAAGVAKAIDEQGIVSWRKALNVLTEADQLALPEELRQRTKLLRQYGRLRLTSFTLLQRSLRDTTHIYDQQIEDLDRQIYGIQKQLEKQ
ncbi:rhomboid family intramembrane serine protease [Spirosoma endophyticum]|nr:rhomboid family intramembrane serine protease [Spirosoma endophyticum]